jgi:hypothetical protein
MSATNIDTNNWIAVAVAVLEKCGGIAHHTVITKTANEYCLNPNNFDLATKMWSAHRKEGDKCRFCFLRNGVFCLAEYQGSRSDEVIKALVPTRSRKQELSAEDISAQINKLQQQLIDLQNKAKNQTK